MVLPNLGCRARVIALHDTANSQSSYRVAVSHSSGSTCDWSALQAADRISGDQLARNQTAQTVAALPANYKGDVLVWRKNGPPLIQKGLTKAEVNALLDQPQVGRVVVPLAKVVKLIDLQSSGCHCEGPPLSFSMGPVTEAATFGRGTTVGIVEANVYNDKTLPHADTRYLIYDDRVKDPVASLQMGECGLGGCNYHANTVASQMWAKCCGYVRESDPISVGVGVGGSEAEYFDRYQAALEFFTSHGVKVINSSIYSDLDPEGCPTVATRDFELLQDYYQYRHGLLVVQAVGNGCGNYGNICLRVTNALTVGSRRSDTSQTANIAFYNAGTLEIPHLVGGCNQGGTDCDDKEPAFLAQDPRQPGCWMCCMYAGNSLNAPAATSLAAIIAELGQRDGKAAATMPQTLRAILMASANYDEEFAKSDTSPTCTGCTAAPTCLQTDCRFGAGELDGTNALRIYQTEDYSSWVVDSPKWQQFSEPFSCEPPRCLVKGAVAWANAVDCDETDCSGDGHVSHDFDLVLEQRINGVWTPIKKAHSRESTTEWLQTSVQISGPADNQFRFAIWQVGRRVARPTQVGFAAFFGDQLRVPTKDLTPPTVKLDVNVNATHLDDLKYKRNVALDDFIGLIAKGEDVDAGLKSISISGDIVARCQKGNLVQTKRFKVMVFEPKEPHDYQPGDTARTKLGVYDSFYVRDFASECSPGYTLTTISGGLGAVVENSLGDMAESMSFRFESSRP